MSTKEQLIAARRLIADGWHQGSSARNANNKAVSIHSAAAASFCATGAVRAVNPDHYDTAPMHALACALPEPFQNRYPEGNGVIEYNDVKGTTQADILALFDQAIAEAPR